jgi:hypothetical protein
MKQMLALGVIALSVVILYRTHQDRLSKATQEAAAQARADTIRSMATPVPTPVPPAPAPSTPAPPAQVLVSRKLEPTYMQLLGAVDANQPFDLVPPIQLIKERLMDRQSQSAGAKRAIYDRAIQLATSMESAAEERTSTLVSMVSHATRSRGALDGSQTTGTGEFFAQGVKSRWDAEVRKRKPAMDQLLGSLRSQEREWNKAADATLPPEDFESPDIPPPTITADPAAQSSNPLERSAYGRTYPWRGQYRDRVRSRFR